MTDLDLEQYQDSYQGMRSVRRQSGPTDAWGNPIRPIADYVHDYDNPIDLAARKSREAAERKSLSRRIGIAITQMERICPPKESAA